MVAVVTREEMDGVLDAIDAGPIEVIRGDVEAAMRKMRVDPESAVKVCVELEEDMRKSWRRGRTW